jgi:hypothetical protein
MLGVPDGQSDGSVDGTGVVLTDGFEVGDDVGSLDGATVFFSDGVKVGDDVGSLDGASVFFSDGVEVKDAVGSLDGVVGDAVGSLDGARVFFSDGVEVGDAVGSLDGVTVSMPAFTLLHRLPSYLHHGIMAHRSFALPRHQASRQNAFFLKVALFHSHFFPQENLPRSEYANSSALVTMNSSKTNAFSIITLMVTISCFLCFTFFEIHHKSNKRSISNVVVYTDNIHNNNDIFSQDKHAGQNGRI